MNDPVAAANALSELATLEPGSAEYNALLAGLNAANMLGTVSDAALVDADLVNQEGQWEGWGQPFPVVRVTDPLLPGEVIGWVTPHVTWYTITSSNLIWAGEGEVVSTTSGPYAHVYYTAVTNPAAEGVTNNAETSSKYLG